MVLYQNAPGYTKISVTGETSLTTLNTASELVLVEQGAGVLLGGQESPPGTITIIPTIMLPLGTSYEHIQCNTVGVLTSTYHPGANQIAYSPVYIGKRGTYTKLACYVVTAQNTKKIRLGLYSASSTTGLPSARLVDGGEITMNSDANVVYELTISQTLSPGIYWFAFLTEATTGSYKSTAVTGILPIMGASMTDSYRYTRCNESFTYGALPSTATPVLQNSQYPLMYIK